MSNISPRIKCTPAHEHAEIFPLCEGPQLWELGKRIAANGLRNEIVLYQGKILDGRRRELACIKEGVTPKYREFGSRKSDGDDPLEFVMDVNFHLRHLGEGDRKLAAAKYVQAKQLSMTQLHGVSQVEKEGSERQTREEAAKRFDVSKSDVDRARVVVANGTPKLQAAVADDTLTVSDAAKVAKESSAVQNKAVDDVKKGKAKSATAAVRAPKSGRPKFDDRQIPTAFGKLHRLFHARAKVYQDSKGFKDIDDAMKKVLAAWERWHLETTGQKR